MPPAGVKSPKRLRQYEHIKESAQKQGRSTARAEQIAAATVNKQRSEARETKRSRKGAAKKKTAKKKTAKSRRGKTSGTRRKSNSRKSTSRKTSTKKTAGRKKR